MIDQEKYYGEPTMVTNKEMRAIIEDRRPKGLFLTKTLIKKKGAYYDAVDNSSGDAWTEQFESEAAARAWLVGDGEAYEYQTTVSVTDTISDKHRDPNSKFERIEVRYILKPKRWREIEEMEKKLAKGKAKRKTKERING